MYSQGVASRPWGPVMSITNILDTHYMLLFFVIYPKKERGNVRLWHYLTGGKSQRIREERMYTHCGAMFVDAALA